MGIGISAGPAPQGTRFGASTRQGSAAALPARGGDEGKDEKAEELKSIDKEVKAHEAAHRAVAGGLVRGESYTFVTGPDGKRYAVAGEVQIDMSTVPGDPRATIQKMEQVIRAALAPANPSPQDMQVAARARAAIVQAQLEERRMAQAEKEAGGPQGEAADSAARPQPTADNARARYGAAGYGTAGYGAREAGRQSFSAFA